MIFIKLIGIFIITSLTTFQLIAKESKLTGSEVNTLWSKITISNNVSIANKYPHQECFKKSAKIHQVDIKVLLAIAKGESNFNAKAKSGANAYGVMQIIPLTGKSLGINSIKELQDPCISIDGGARYFKRLLKRYVNNFHLALAAYNYGPTAIKPTMAQQGMPKGAVWYSHYIYDHYQSIKGQSLIALYKPDNQINLLYFNQPYRAKAFTEYLKKQDSRLRIEYFKERNNRYIVVVRYQNQSEYTQSKAILKKYGWPGS